MREAGRYQRWAMRAALAAALSLTVPQAMAQTVRMWTFLNPSGKSGREIVMKQLIDGFEAANPGVKIQVEVQDYRTIGTKFLAANQSGAAPDVAMINVSNMIGVVKAGALANLNDLFIKNWPKEEIDDLDTPFWHYATTATARYAIFITPAIYGQFYRVDLFKKAGIDPKSLDTWDKFIAAAQKLTVRDAAGNVTQWGFGQSMAGGDPATPIVFSVLMDKDGTIFDKNFHAAWATPAGVQGLQMVVDMVDKYKITPPDAVTTIADDAVQEFGAGRMAMLRGGVARLPSAIAMLGGKGEVGYLPTPSFTEGKNSPTGCAGWAVTIWQGSKQKELASKFLEFVTSRKAATLWMTVAGQPPMRKSTVGDNPAFVADPKNHFMIEAAEDMEKNCWLAPVDAGAGGWDEGLQAAQDDAIASHTDPKAALQKAEAVFNRSRR